MKTNLWINCSVLILMTQVLLSCSTEPVPPKPVDRPLIPQAEPRPGQPAPNVQTPRFPPAPVDDSLQQGYVSLYALQDHGAATASGETYDLYGMTAAHPHWPLGIYVRVMRGKRQVVVRINDRNRDGAALRLSYQAAQSLGLTTGAELQFQALKPPAKNMKHLQRQSLAPVAHEQARYYVQAGAFNSLPNAKQLKLHLRTELSQAVRILPGNDLYRVQIGPLSNSQARLLLSQLPAYGVDSGFLVPLR